MLLSQIKTLDGNSRVVVRDGTEAYIISGVSSTYELVMKSIKNGLTLAEQINRLEFEQAVDLHHLHHRHQLITPIDKPSDIHMHVSGLQEMRTMPKIAEISVVGQDGNLFTVGFCMAYILPTELISHRAAPLSLQVGEDAVSLGPEILTGDLPEAIMGTLSQVRNGQVIYKDRLSLNEIFIAYPRVKFKFETSHTADVFIQLFSPFERFQTPDTKMQDGDVFELAIDQFGLPLDNPWKPNMLQKQARA